MVRQPTSFSIAPIYAPAARSRLKIERFNIAIPCRQQFWPTLGRFSNNHTSTNHPSGANLPRIRLHHKSSFGECVLSVFHARGHHSQRTSLQYFAESRWGQHRNGVPGIQRNRRRHPDHQARYSTEIRPELRSRGQYKPVVCRQRRIWARQTGHPLEGPLSEDRRPGDVWQGQWCGHIHDELSVARSGTSELLGKQRSCVHWAALT